ncbi:hypothetical protein ABZW30_33365 [Kitasatospora sp. NPDC004669]|uniref:hypothetical protein n=1 Tax=Kitasatospora sp. NPDC004669 TaxID=3154555 RepID=UPI0033B750CC
MKKTTFAVSARVATLAGLVGLGLTTVTACSGGSADTAKPANTAKPAITPPSTAVAPGSAGSAAPAQAAAHGDATRYQASSWLPAKSLPLYGTYLWVSENTEDPKSTDAALNWMYACSDNSKEPTATLEVSAYQTRQYKTDLKTDPRAGAFQWMLFFKDEATAKAALTKIENDYSSCAARESDDSGPTTVVKTATGSGGVSWLTTSRDKDGKPHIRFTDVGADAHEYFVQSGNVISLVQALGDTPAIDPAPADDQVLSAMAAALATMR